MSDRLASQEPWTVGLCGYMYGSVLKQHQFYKHIAKTKYIRYSKVIDSMRLRT